jgi:glucose-1-phosphate thymidylyltransferase
MLQFAFSREARIGAKRKGIILAGGSGTRLYPVTRALSKQLTPVYDKPLIYYALSTLMLAGIRDILVITTPQDQFAFVKLLGDGGQWGISLSYATQRSPDGLAQAFLIGRQFIGRDASALVLGDNIFYGGNLSETLRSAAESTNGATIFVYEVRDPERYGIASFDGSGNPIALVEKPRLSTSHWAITGLYFYDNDVIDIAAGLRPSARGELEITDVNKAYLARGQLKVVKLGRGYCWFDAGTHDSLLEASRFVSAIQQRQGLQIACPEEIAYRQHFIGSAELERLAAAHGKNDYGVYLMRLLRELSDSSETHTIAS